MTHDKLKKLREGIQREKDKCKIERVELVRKLNAENDTVEGLGEIEDLIDKIDACLFVLDILLSFSEEEIQKICPYNIKNREINLTSYYDKNKDVYDDRLFVICMAFAGELVLFFKRESFYGGMLFPPLVITFDDSIRERWSLMMELKNVWLRFCADKYNIDEELEVFSENIKKNTLIDVINIRIGRPDYQAFLNYENTVAECQKEKDKLDALLSEHQNKADKLKDVLENYQKAFNFVGLSQGFERLLKNKKTAKWLSFGLLVALSLLALAPLPFQLLRKIHTEHDNNVAIHAARYRFGICINLFLPSGFEPLSYNTDANHAA